MDAEAKAVDSINKELEKDDTSKEDTELKGIGLEPWIFDEAKEDHQVVEMEMPLPQGADAEPTHSPLPKDNGHGGVDQGESAAIHE